MSNVNFFSKAQFFFPKGFNLTLSVQKVKPEDYIIMMFDVGALFQNKMWHVKCEYLRKHYEDNAFKPVNALDVFVNYDIPLNAKLFRKISPLCRYEYMLNQSGWKKYLNNLANPAGSLIVNDYKRHRLTSEITLSLCVPFVADIRMDCDKYFYDHAAYALPSEKDKIVFELMTRF